MRNVHGKQKHCSRSRDVFHLFWRIWVIIWRRKEGCSRSGTGEQNSPNKELQKGQLLWASRVVRKGVCSLVFLQPTSSTAPGQGSAFLCPSRKNEDWKGCWSAVLSQEYPPTSAFPGEWGWYVVASPLLEAVQASVPQGLVEGEAQHCWYFLYIFLVQHHFFS